MRVQVTNVGGQVLPVLQGIVEYPCDRVILIHTLESKQIANNITNAIESEFELLEIDDANNFGLILSICKELCKVHLDDEWYINVSGGTKIMSLALFAFFREQNMVSNIFHIDQNGLVHSLINENSYQLKNYLPIKSYFNFCDQKVKSMIRFENIEEEYFEISDEIKKFYDRNDQEFMLLCRQYFKQYSKTSHNFENFELTNPKSYSTASWNNANLELILSLVRKYKTQPDEFLFYGRESIGIVFEARWFELEVAKILSKWNKTKELIWSLIVPYKDGQDKNEIDLIVNLGNKLLFVECKTQISDIKDIDKFRNVTKNYGGLGAKSILITYSKPAARFFEKCKDNNILLFYFCEKSIIVNSVNDLYQILNDEILKTNTF